MKPRHKPHLDEERPPIIYMAGRPGRIMWEDGTEGHYLCLFASDFYLRVKDTINGKEFVTVREALWRFYPDEQV